ncbi:MAG: hypothetical protein IPN72_22675 [Saprospiraceae bacterium]|nr:hypothetical protein [Saprospiraceae bacterium]
MEATGGIIHLENYPLEILSLSAKEIIGNESQERMGIVIAKRGFSTSQDLAVRKGNGHLDL